MRCCISATNWSVLLLLCLIITAAGCLRSAQIFNVYHAPVASGIDKNNKLTLEEVDSAIIAAGAGLGWKMRTESPGHIVAVLDLRAHQATVDINYDADKYDIIYISSKNLNEANGKIHSNYNGWVQNLNNAIGKELAGVLTRKK